jgi:hypothetical protein
MFANHVTLLWPNVAFVFEVQHASIKRRNVMFRLCLILIQIEWPFLCCNGNALYLCQ